MRSIDPVDDCLQRSEETGHFSKYAESKVPFENASPLRDAKGS